MRIRIFTIAAAGVLASNQLWSLPTQAAEADPTLFRPKWMRRKVTMSSLALNSHSPKNSSPGYRISSRARFNS